MQRELMKTELLSTGEAAKLCSVTSDTVLKWIHSGRLPATRTPGGHHRISKYDLIGTVGAEPEPAGDADTSEKPTTRSNHFQYCWEFNGNGELLDGCRDCVVYEMRAKRCYEVVERAKEVGHNKIFCKQSCDNCDYYRVVHKQAVNILVVTDNVRLVGELKKGAKKVGFNLETTDCEYRCSALVDVFRPDFAVVDCSLGAQFARDITDHIIQDPRVPFLRVILAADSGGFPAECNQEVFARIEKPFNAGDIAECISLEGRRRVG
jgi:excisionase family DNA binding protein